MLDYLHAHPSLIPILVGIAIGLSPQLVQLLVGFWQSRSAVNAKRLELRHAMSTRWLAEFSAAATRYHECLKQLRGSVGRTLTMDQAIEANTALQRSVEDLMDICAVLIFLFPRHWLAQALGDCVLELYELSGRPQQRLTHALQGAIEAEVEGVLRSASDLDKASAQAVPQPLASPEEIATLLGNFAMLRSLAHSAVEARLMQNRFALRRWHLKGDLRSLKESSARLRTSVVPDR